MKSLIILNIVGFAAAFLNSTVVLFNKSGAEIGYGIIVAPDILVLPSDEVYQEMQTFTNYEKYVKNSNEVVKFNLLSHNFTKVNNATFVLKLNNGSKVSNKNTKLRISRYPFCENTKNLSVVGTADLDVLESHLLERKLQSKSFSGHLCQGNKSVCGPIQSQQQLNGSPLINEMDKYPYLIGLFDQKTAAYKLLTHTCDTLPQFDYCNYLLHSTANVTFCNALEMSRNLEESGYSEVVLIGTIQYELPSSFIPTGFALIVGDRNAIVFSDVLLKIEAQIKNYEIYGNGEFIGVAIMTKKKVAFLGNYESINFGKTNIKLLKFKDAEFEHYKKARFFFDETYENATDITNLETLQFVNQKLSFQNQTKVNRAFKFLLGTPVFHRKNVVGFQQNGTFVSAFEMKEFLEQNVRHLDVEKTTTTTITTDTKTLTSAISETTVAFTISTFNYSNTKASTNLSNSNSFNFTFLSFLLTLISYFQKF